MFPVVPVPKALATERADGNLREAIRLYERIVKEFASDRPLAARALVRMGECYELGDADAQKTYERVIHEFGDQRDAVADAQTRLASLRQAAPTLPPGLVAPGRYGGYPRATGARRRCPQMVGVRGLYRSKRDANIAAWQEGKRLLEDAMAKRLVFAFETTLGGETMTSLLRRALAEGVEVRMQIQPPAWRQFHCSCFTW